MLISLFPYAVITLLISIVLRSMSLKVIYDEYLQRFEKNGDIADGGNLSINDITAYSKAAIRLDKCFVITSILSALIMTRYMWFILGFMPAGAIAITSLDIWIAVVFILFIMVFTNKETNNVLKLLSPIYNDYESFFNIVGSLFILALMIKDAIIFSVLASMAYGLIPFELYQFIIATIVILVVAILGPLREIRLHRANYVDGVKDVHIAFKECPKVEYTPRQLKRRKFIVWCGVVSHFLFVASMIVVSYGFMHWKGLI